MIKPLSKAYSYWDRFWFGPISPYPLAGMRILFGFYLLCHFIIFLPAAAQIFSNEGIYVPIIVGDIAPPPFMATAIYLLFLVSILCFTLGFYTRIATVMVLAGYVYHYLLEIGSHNFSYDQIMLVLLMILSFADLDQVWSIRNLWSKKQERQEIYIMAWPQRMITIYISFIYYGMCAYKFFDVSWHNGVMLEQNLHGEWATPLAFWLIGLNFPPVFYTFLSWTIIIAEGACSAGFWFRPVQYFFFAVGILFHAMIGLLLNIPEFLFLPACYVLYMDPRVVRAKGNAFLNLTEG